MCWYLGYKSAPAALKIVFQSKWGAKFLLQQHLLPENCPSAFQAAFFCQAAGIGIKNGLHQAKNYCKITRFNLFSQNARRLPETAASFSIGETYAATPHFY